MRIWIPFVLLSLPFCLAAQEAAGAAQEAAGAAQTGPDEQEYGGPAVLSRSTTASISAKGETIKFRPFLSLDGVYDQGMAGISVTPDGRVESHDLYGAQATAGVYGVHNWKKTVVGLDYRGSYRHYSRKTYFDGSDQILSLLVTHQTSRHTTLSLRESAGTFSRGLGFAGALQLVDPLYATVPQEQLFDSRVYYLGSSADFTYQKSARLSFNMGGDEFVVRYRSNALYGLAASRVRGDVAYRYSRHGTIGVAYDFSHFGFTKSFGGSDLHTIALVHSMRLSRSWEWNLKVGGARVETQAVGRVQLDPAIAAIIGQSVGIQAIHRTNYIPSIHAQLTKTFRRASISWSYANGVSPGNGIYLTSATQAADVGVRYTGIRKWNFGAMAGYNSFRSLTLTLGGYHSYHAGAGITYRVARHIHLNSRLDGRKYLVDSATGASAVYRRVVYRASIGIAFSPDEIPLALW